MPIKVLIVDDHEFVRMALRQLLDTTDDIHVVGTCADGSEVVAAAEELAPDVVLMDVGMPKVNGLEATRALLARQPHVRVLIHTGIVDMSCLTEGRALGVVGLILKDDDPSALPDRIREVAAGGTWWSPNAVVRPPTSASVPAPAEAS